ncbi:MAG TPA: ice-binding family protein [Candidatus Eisenbacteria bacterium]|nr:ice-binding family protein [Candidatus Eisenbacteria bacterium]
MREGRYVWILAPLLVLAMAGCADDDKPLGVAEGGADSPATVDLGSAASYGVVASTSVNNTGTTTIHGDLGVDPGNTLTGSPTVTGDTDLDNAASADAQTDLQAAFDDAESRATGAITITEDMAGLSIGPGLYTANQLTNSGIVTLNGLGDSTAVFIFQSDSGLTAQADSRILLDNGARAENVFWVVGTSATLGSDSEWVGTILADDSITLQSGATLLGRALSQSGSVTLDTNVITVP